MKKVLMLSLVAVAGCFIIYSCNKKSVGETKKSNSVVNIESTENSLDHYFTSEEKNYLNENFGEYDYETFNQAEINNEKITTICSKLNNEYSSKKLIISEKTINGVLKVKKEIYIVSSTTSKTLNETINDISSTSLGLNRAIVNINVGTMYSMDENDNLTEIQLGINIDKYGFGSCFKSCYAEKMRSLGRNFAVLVLCVLAIPECIAAIAIECTWECLW